MIGAIMCSRLMGIPYEYGGVAQVIKIKPVEVLPAGQWVGGEVRNGPEKIPARNIELPIGRTRPSKTPK